VGRVDRTVTAARAIASIKLPGNPAHPRAWQNRVLMTDAPGWADHARP